MSVFSKSVYILSLRNMFMKFQLFEISTFVISYIFKWALTSMFAKSNLKILEIIIFFKYVKFKAFKQDIVIQK